MKYIALLRGINVGGNNKVSMPQLKKAFEALGFENVATYINSGNVIFDSAETDATKLVENCEQAIRNDFRFQVVCAVIAASDLHDAVEHAPAWWGKDDQDKHNALFVIAPTTPAQVMAAVGEAKPEYEKVAQHGPVIFWTAPLETFSRTRYSKIVATSAYKSVTIRNANTTRKLVELTLNHL